MQCEVLLFAQLAEAAGTNRMTIDLPDQATAGDALEHVCRLHERIAAMRDHIAIAVDEQYAPPSRLLSGDCTIALIPPVSGG